MKVHITAEKATIDGQVFEAPGIEDGWHKVKIQDQWQTSGCITPSEWVNIAHNTEKEMLINNGYNTRRVIVKQSMKLSRSQQLVVDYLKHNQCFIVKSKYYNHQKIIKKHVGAYNYRYQLHQFTRPTFDCLLKLGIIEQSVDNPSIYILAK